MNVGFKHEGDEIIDEVLLDRLVDGELAGAEYRRVLQLLEAHPQQWRRCALAFLESQALRSELRRREPRGGGSRGGVRGGILPGGDEPVADEYGRMSVHAVRAVSRPEHSPSRWSWSVGGLVTLASAASVLLTLVLAGSVQWGPLPWRQNTATNLPGSAPVGMGATMVSNGSPQLPDGRWGDYHMLVRGEDGRERQIIMPIYSADDPRAALLASDEATAPVEMLRALRRLGFQVDRQRQWAPVGEDADRPVIVPVEEWRITPVSSQSYQ